MDLVLDCRKSMDELHVQISQALAFPPWYGHNLDALHDCLTALSTELTITLIESERLPKLRRVLCDCAMENPNIRIK